MEIPVRVVARVKPLMYEDDETCIQVAPAASQIVLGFDNFCDFDAVFGDDISQKDLYATCLSDIATNIFQGFNTTVITYGQQGSGKTYTMVGPDFLRAMSEEEFGLIPQAVRHIFKMMNQVPEREYRVHISYLIIHQESVYDLLSSSLTTLNVLEDNHGNVVIPGLTVIDCNNISEVLNCLEAGLLQRHSASTQGFDLTAAHTVFNLTLEHQWSDQDGKLNYIYSRHSFVDLAGSEESSTSFESNEMGILNNALKNNFIFSSDLKALANIICSLTNRNQRALLPFRSSRLTHILKDSFGGNSLTLMVCCLSPSTKDYEASHNTLKLGCLTRYVLNFPVPNVVTQNSIHSVAPLMNANATSVWSSCPSTYTANLSSTSLSNGATMLPSVTPLPHLSVGLPPNLRVIQQAPIPHPDAPLVQIARPDNSLPQKNEEIFRVQFAASQWHQLVSSAEDLLAEILQSGCISPSDKTRIESWLCMKAEADDCIGADLPQLQTHTDNNRPLEVIEELSEPDEVSEVLSVRTPSCNIEDPESESEVSSSVLSLGEEFYDQLETLKEKFQTLTSNLIRQVEEKKDAREGLCQQLASADTVETTVDTKESSLRASNESLRERIESMVVSTSSSTTSISIPAERLKNEVENMWEKDKENLAANFGSRVSLLSRGSASSPVMKRTGKSQKKQKKMVDKLKRISIRGRQQLPASSGSSPEMMNSSNGDLVSEDDLPDSSENELLKRVSSKLVSVSRGSSKCVSNLKTKSCQLKHSIRSHIFRRRNKSNQVSVETESSKISLSSELVPCPVRRVSDELRVAQQRLKELEATIKVKEAFISELRQSCSEAAATRRKCHTQIEQLESELKDVQCLHYKAQNKLREADPDDEEKVHYRSKVDMYSRQVNQIQKRLACLRKVASISQQSDSKLKELEESIRDLRQQQEELHTQLRQELQRKQQLEQQILREDRCARNPLCSSKLLDEDSDKDCEMKSATLVPPDQVTAAEEVGKTSHSKKRKLVSSTGDSQSESHCSWKGENRSRRDRRKAGRLELNSLDMFPDLAPKSEDDNITVSTRKEIDLLRTAKDRLVNKRQKIDKKIRKGRARGDGREEERVLLELDEVVEGLDAIIELKNGIISGKITQIQPFFPILAKIDLEENLRRLPLEELHFLLIKYFNRVIDLRIEFRRHELAFAELENQFDEQSRYISNLKAAYQQASLEMERRLTSLQREYQYKISYLLRHFNDDSSGYGMQEMKLLDLEQQVYYYKKLSRELKEKLKQYLQQGPSSSRHMDAIPGPSGIKNHSSHDPANGIFPPGDRPCYPSSVVPSWPNRRGRRFAIHSANPQTKVTREKNKLIIQQKGDNLNS